MPKTTNVVLIVCLAGVTMFCVLPMGCLMFSAAMVAMDPEFKAKFEAERKAQTERQKKESAAAKKESQSSPKSRPEPEPELPAPPYREIASKAKTMTDAQWNIYAETLRGTTVKDWQGTVLEVNEGFLGYEVWIDMDEPSALSVQDVTMPISKENALRWNKGDRIKFSGKIGAATNVFTKLMITLE